MAAIVVVVFSALLFLLLPSTLAARKGAFLVFSKKLNPPHLVEGLNVTITYTVHNIGDGAATKVTLRDNAYPRSWFQLHSGTLTPTLPTLSPGASHTVNTTLTPLKSGELSVIPPAVRYQDVEGDRHVTKLDADDVVLVEDQLTYRRRTDRHVWEWIAYVMGMAALCGGPYIGYLGKVAKVTGKVVEKKK